MNINIILSIDSATIKASPIIDYLIIGAGLAGSSLAWRLGINKYNYKIFDSRNLASASQVAAGFINPVTGKWMTESWKIDYLMPKAKAFYQDIEERLGINIVQDLPIRRYFINQEDPIRARRRIKNPRYANYFDPILEKGSNPNGIIDDFGSIPIRQGSWVNVPSLIQNLKSYFKSQDSLIDDTFDANQLEQNGQHWNYRGIKTKNIVFCQGIHTRENPFFKDLPIIPIKGDVLDIRLKDIQLPLGLYYKKRWLHSLKTKNQDFLYRIGASYDVGNSDTIPCSSAREELVSVLKDMLGTNLLFEIEEHRSGIRPTTKDAKPLLIRHPTHSSLFAINGLGSKGSAIAPYLSELFMDQMGKEFPKF